MSLATRCTACGTIFRVVQDQLRVSEGWVRCGRCAEVFDAREQMFDIDREAPPPWPAEAPTPVQESQIQMDIASAPEPQTWHQASDATDVFVDAEPPAAPSRPQKPEPEAHPEPEPDCIAARDSGFDSPVSSLVDPQLNARLEPQWVDEDETVARPLPQAAKVAESIAMGDGPDVVLTPRLAEITETGVASEPSFMRSLGKAQRWQRPGVRVAIGGGVAISLVLLGLQLGHHFRDALASLYPSARPALQALCQMTGCELRPWRRIDVVSVENSALSQAGAGNQYQLAVSLHNKSGLEVATPWIELNLTDATGAVVVRRMLAPADFKSGKNSLPAGSDLPLQVLLTTGQQRVSGYSVEIFHP